jgi:hypothetical protein
MTHEERLLLINDKMFYLLFGSPSIKDFEIWVYEDENLKDILPDNGYLELIELDYRKDSAKYEIEKILGKYLDYGSYEKRKMIRLLEEALKRTEKLPYILMEFYDLYCHGYTFLDDLGLGYGLMCEVPPSKLTADSWDELKEKEKNELLSSFFPNIENDLKRAYDWIISDKIIFTGEKIDDLIHWKYIDNRTEDERKSSMWVEVYYDPKEDRSVSKNTMWEKIEKKWWEFWK